MFHLDWLNNRMLIAIIAILHVMINHGLAVGFIPYITWLEYKGVKNSKSNQITDLDWDNLIYKKMKVAFIITTTVGAMTGVGIWFSAALVSPASIGSLIRVFFWAWFTEWIVFVTEVVLILIYFLTWKNSNKSLKAKLRHIRFGWFLAIFSWITMALIVAILGFMMDPGSWHKSQNFLNGVFNPIYLPQLFFRTPAAMLIGGVYGLLMATIFGKKGTEIRSKAIKFSGIWILFWTPIALLGATYYWGVMPEAMKANMSTAVGTMQFELFYDTLKYVIIGCVSLTFVIALWSVIKPKTVKLYMVIIPFFSVLAFLGVFERVREFIRKPYVIGGYMYSNLLRVEDYPLYKRDGVLKYATYSSVSKITEENKVEAGKNVFIVTCSRCHTTNGVNSITYVFERMYGPGKSLDTAAISAYIPNMHVGRTYMPPFPGNAKELNALSAYIKSLQNSGIPLEGAQTVGVKVNPENSVEGTIRMLEDKKKK